MRVTRFSSLAMLAVTTALSASAFAAVAPIAYPVDSDGAQTANIARRYQVGGTLLGGAGGADITGLVNQENGPLAAIDGAGTMWVLQGAANDPNASLKLRLTLDQVYSVKKFVNTFGFAHMPQQYEIWTSTTGFDGSLVQRVGPTATAFVSGEIYKDVLGTAVDAKYIEVRMKGVGGSGRMMHAETQIFADGAAPQLDTSMGYNITSLGTMTATDITPGKWLDPVSRAIDRVVDFNNKIRGANAGNASFVVDLGAQFNLTSMSMGFLHNGAWSTGAKVEVSTDGVNYVTVRDQVGGNFGTQSFQSRIIDIRYVRVTDYNGRDESFTELEIFTPEPGSAVVLCLAACAMLKRRARKSQE